MNSYLKAVRARGRRLQLRRARQREEIKRRHGEDYFTQKEIERRDRIGAGRRAGRVDA